MCTLIMVIFNTKFRCTLIAMNFQTKNLLSVLFAKYGVYGTSLELTLEMSISVSNDPRDPERDRDIHVGGHLL